MYVVYMKRTHQVALNERINFFLTTLYPRKTVGHHFGTLDQPKKIKKDWSSRYLKPGPPAFSFSIFSIAKRALYHWATAPFQVTSERSGIRYKPTAADIQGCFWVTFQDNFNQSLGYYNTIIYPLLFRQNPTKVTSKGTIPEAFQDELLQQLLRLLRCFQTPPLDGATVDCYCACSGLLQRGGLALTFRLAPA